MADNNTEKETLHHVKLGEGRPVLILHGGKLDHRHMVEALEPAFQGQTGWQRIYLDLPGHGQSGSGDTINSQDDVLGAVINFVGRRLPNQSFAVIGESRGSYIAQGLAHSRPDLVDGLLLIVPGGNTDVAKDNLPEHETRVRTDHLRPDLEPEEVGRFDRLVVQTADILDKIRRTKIPATALHDPKVETRVQNNFDFSFDAENPETPFDKPCLILSGRQDSIAGYADTMNNLGTYPRATYALLDCAGHSLSWERPDLFKALVQDWLCRLSIQPA